MRFKGSVKSSGIVNHQSSCCNTWGCSLSLYSPFARGDLHRLISAGWRARKTTTRKVNDFKLAKVACLGWNSWFLFTAGQDLTGRSAQSFSKIITYFPKKGISENQKLYIDLYQNWKIVAAKSKSLFFGCGIRKWSQNFLSWNFSEWKDFVVCLEAMI